MRYALLSLSLLGCPSAPVVPTATARPGGLEIEPVAGLGLFAEERVQSQAVLAGALASRDAGIIPVEVTQRAWALAAEGRNPLTGAVCGKPLGPWAARKRWGAALGITASVTSEVWCELDGGCELSVSDRPLSDAVNDRFQLVAPFSEGGPALTALADAVQHLAPPVPRLSGGVGGLLGSAGRNEPLQEEDRLDLQLWLADRRDRTELELGRKTDGFPTLTVAQVLACLPPDDVRLEVLIEVTPEGVIGRCEGGVAEDAAQARCGCGQLQKVAAAPWLAGKRWKVELHVDRRDQTTSDRRLVLTGAWNTWLQRVQAPGEKAAQLSPKVEDPSLVGWTPGPPRLATGCFANAFTAAGSLSSRWAVWFDAQGQATKAVEQQGFPPLQKDLAECVARALKTAQSPCPSRAGLWAMADLRVTARDPWAPAAPLQDLIQKTK